MASGTINGSTGNEHIDAKVEWTSTSNTSTNKSTVTAALYYKRNNTGFTTYGTGAFSCTINGVKATSTKTLTITENAWVKAVEATVTVTHDEDGKKSITISASGSISGTSLTSTSVSGTAVLDAIPRASVIASASNVTLGKACNVKWAPKAKAFRYKLKFSLGSWSYTTDAIHPNTTSTYTYDDYPIPLTAANQLPKAKTGTMTATLYTFSDSGATKQVGSASSKTFTVTVPENDSTKPTATMTLSPVTSLASPFNALYIKGMAKVKATFTNGDGKYGADIASYTMKVSGMSYGEPYTSGYLSTSGTVTVEGVVTDTRGISRKYTQSITVLSYGNPTLLPADGESKIICARCDANGNLTESGTYLKIKARRSYYTVKSGGVQKNFCAIRYRYREESSNTFSAWKTILAKDNTATDTIDAAPIANVVSSTETAYVVQVGVIDDIGKTNSVKYPIPTDFVALDIPAEGKGRRIGIGRHAGEEDGIYFGLPVFGESVDFVTESGVWNVDDSDPNKGYWRYRVWNSGAVDMNGLVKVTPVTEGTIGTAGMYYSEVIYLDLPFEVVNFNFTGSVNAYHCFVGNCNSVDGNYKQARLRLYRFTDFAGLADYDVFVRIVASGKLK